MKAIILLGSLLLSIVSVGQNQINLSINHKVDTEELEFNQEFTLSDDNKATLFRVEYYVSQISITHDGGQTTDIEDTWLLVNSFSPELYDLGEHDINSVESVSFYIGVETPENNDDPTLWPSDHPLAPQLPSMHWGWDAGYRFVALEGRTGEESAAFDFEIHALGNSNYLGQTIPAVFQAEDGVVNIALDADYTACYEGLETSAGGITHGEGGSAVTVLNNFQTSVFSQGEFVGIDEELSNPLEIRISPNPSSAGVNSTLNIENGESLNANIQIFDVKGSVVFEEIVNSSSLRLPLLNSGVYTIVISEEREVLGTEKWIVE